MMPTCVSSRDLEAVRQRYLALYTGAVSDILDKAGYRDQVLPHYVTPLTSVDRVAGPAFTGQGHPCPAHDDTGTRLKMLDSIGPGSVCVWACGGSTLCAHWGEIMSTAARQHGSIGAVLDGGVRDLKFINALNYPVFARFQCSASSIGRWEIQAYQVTIKIGDTVIHPGDFVFGDVDGVVIVPAALTLATLDAAEDVCRRETGMRDELRRGVSVKEAHAKYGAF